eukprot:scaffold136966_cov30-Tisochrysis_lutea.AAC.2
MAVIGARSSCSNKSFNRRPPPMPASASILADGAAADGAPATGAAAGPEAVPSPLTGSLFTTANGTSTGADAFAADAGAALASSTSKIRSRPPQMLSSPAC